MNKINNRVFVVGDIHGYSEALLELLTKVNFDYENDKLISIGDLCDRGPDTWGVIEILLKIKNMVFINGNHDFCFKQHLSGNKLYDDWYHHQGKNTIKSYKENNWNNFKKHNNFLFNSVLYYVENNICFVHAGFDNENHISNQPESILCFDRYMVNKVMNNNIKLETKDKFDKIFLGHTPTICWSHGKEYLMHSHKQVENPITTPIIKHGYYLIDTGCAKGGHLTLFNVYENTFIQTEKKY